MPSLGSYLQPLGIGELGNMKDYAHASRLYVDDTFALAPKNSWIYYVVFDIDPSTITDQTWANQQRVSELGMLVKQTDLPKFSIQTEVVNQYNRKTVVQKGIDYQPVSLVFHDDNSNVVHNMWLNYFRYYYSDPRWNANGQAGTAKTTTPGAYQNNKYLPPNDLFNPVNYGMNSELVVAPFFRSITIYQLNRKLFTSYTLINPIIKSWEHDRLDQTNGGKFAESKMTVDYETVFYGVGRVKKDTPTGFAVFHYDTSPSPLSVAGGGNSSILGPGGIVDGAIDLFGDVSNLLNPDAKTGPLDLLGTVIQGANLVKNIGNVNLNSIKAEGYSILDNLLGKTSQGALNGLGVNLNLNKGNGYATAGQFLGTPVAVVTAQAVAQDFTGGTTTRSASPNGTAPTSSSVADNAQAQANQIAQATATISNSQFTESTDDIIVTGLSTSPGSYYKDPTALISPALYSTNIDAFSTPAEIDSALQTLNNKWAGDLDLVSSQAIYPDSVMSKLNSAGSPQEFDAIKAASTYALNITQTQLNTVNSNYSTEYTRLTTIQQTVQNNTLGSGTLQSSGDSIPGGPITFT